MLEFVPLRDRLRRMSEPEAVPAVEVEVISKAVPDWRELAATESPEDVPVPVVVPEVMATVPVEAGARVILPEVVVCRARLAEVELTVKPPEVTDQVEAAAPVKFKAPAEVTARVPEVAVEMVKFPEVFVQAEVPPEATVKAPVELPSVVVEPAPVE